MATFNKKIYWDTCVFLAWFYNEPNEAGVVDGIEETVRDVDHKRVKLLTSIVTKNEILETRMDSAQRAKFDGLFKRRNVVMVDLDNRITDLSHEIRCYYDQQGIVLGSMDTYHLATAIIHEVDAMYTLDGKGKKSKGKLLPLSGTIAGKYKLQILKPHATASNLLTGLP